MLFISHANPEDNEFAKWLALRLGAEGFPVWCDLTQLLGGETFWTDVEEAIRERTAKFLFVLSRASNHKPGAIQELGLAKNVQRAHDLRDFVLPLGIDDLSPTEFNIQLGQLNVIPFQAGWHIGLDRLVDKLERDRVARRSNFDHAAVASWWRERMNTDRGVLDEPESLVTNLYPVRPLTLHFHRLALKLENAPIEPATIPYPAERFREYLVSFATAADLEPHLGTGVAIAESQGQSVGPGTSERHPWSFGDERATLTKLLNRAWQAMLQARELPTRVFATGAPALYFKAGMVEDDWLRFREPDGSPGSRQVVGIKKTGESIRYWHFGLGARPTTVPTLGYVMRPHVLFSDDGETIWESAPRLAKARRSQCKQWWNDRWRDLIYGTVQFLARGADAIHLPVGSEVSLEVLTNPLEVACPVTYDEQVLEESSVTEAVDDLDANDLEDDDEEETPTL